MLCHSKSLPWRRKEMVWRGGPQVAALHITALVSVALALTGCLGERPGKADSVPLNFRERILDYSGPELGEPEARDVTEVRIGWFAPSDPGHELGGGMWTAANLAIEKANLKGGYRGRPFRLVPNWSENPWTGGVGPLFRTVYREHLWALLGGLDGPSTHLAEQVVAKARLPLVSPISTDKSVNLAGVPWMFSCVPDDGQLAPLLADAVLTRAGGGPLVLVNMTDHDSRATAKELLKAFSVRKRVPGLRLEFAPVARDFGPQLRALDRAAPRAVLVVANPTDSARLVRAIRELAPDCALFGTHHVGHAAFLRRAGAASEGVCFPLLFHTHSANRGTRKFVEEFSARHASPPDYTAAYTYDATRVLIAAIRRGGLNRARIRQAMRKLSPWQGITGAIRWDGTGQNRGRRPILGVIRGGKVDR